MNDQLYYDYRLILPTGLVVEKKLPFIALAGDVIGLHNGSFKVIGVDPTLIHSNACTLYLEKY
jgi:hypothetical protein